MAGRYALVPVFVVLLNYAYICQTNGNKRILLNDIDVQSELISLKATVQELQSKVQQQENTIHQLVSQANGAMYIRWGRKQCPDNETELVYSGFAGGSMYNNPGAAADYLCLPSDPVLSSKDASLTISHFTGKYSSYVYGAEYETNFFGPNSEDEDVPCAVCRSRFRVTSMMIPGRNHCYNGWKTEYTGNLAAGYFEYKSSSIHVCVDQNPEFLNKGQGNEDGKLFYPVITACGSLPCPPYENHKPLTCVVCTK